MVNYDIVNAMDMYRIRKFDDGIRRHVCMTMTFYEMGLGNFYTENFASHAISFLSGFYFFQKKQSIHRHPRRCLPLLPLPTT